MRSQGQFYIGGAIILIGVLFLIGNVTNIDIGDYCWPIAFILLGVLLLARPQMIGPDTVLTQRFFGEIKRERSWQVQDEEFWAFVNEVELDMTEAEIPEGETRIRAIGFIGDIELYIPKDVEVSVSSTAFVSEVEMPEYEEERIFVPLHLQRDNYKTARKKIRLETTCFVSEIKVRHV